MLANAARSIAPVLGRSAANVTRGLYGMGRIGGILAKETVLLPHTLARAAGFKGSFLKTAWAPKTHGLIGGLAKAGISMGVASSLSAAADSQWAESMAPATRLGMKALSFGFQVGALRQAARGALGSGLYGAEAAMQTKGASAKALGTVRSIRSRVVDRGLGGMFLPGSYMNWGARMVGRGAFHGARAAATLPFRMATGTIAAGAVPFRMIGAAARGTAVPVERLLSPRLPAWLQGGRQSLQRKVVKGIWGKQMHAGLGYGAFTLGVAGGTGAAWMQHTYGGGMSPGNTWSDQPGSRADYGGGVGAIKRGTRSNYGPALTLALHHRSSRVMP